jgi:hypothetical protein
MNSRESQLMRLFATSAALGLDWALPESKPPRDPAVIRDLERYAKARKRRERRAVRAITALGKTVSTKEVRK